MVGVEGRGRGPLETRGAEVPQCMEGCHLAQIQGEQGRGRGSEGAPGDPLMVTVCMEGWRQGQGCGWAEFLSFDPPAEQTMVCLVHSSY